MTALLPNPWSSDNSVPLTVDEALEVIDNSRRRHVLMLLDDQDGETTVNDLAKAIAAIELDKDIPKLDAQERKNIYISLIQHHLDILDELGAIDYRERSKHVYATEATDGLITLIRHLKSVCEDGS